MMTDSGRITPLFVNLGELNAREPDVFSKRAAPERAVPEPSTHFKTISAHERFRILVRDEFTCAFCSGKPGNDHLRVAHLVPLSQRGSDAENNLITACDRCVGGRGARLVIPARLCTGERDESGWSTWKQWGKWVLQWSADGEGSLMLTFEPKHRDYWIEISRVHEQDWHDHLSTKPWISTDDWLNFCEAIHFARALVRPRTQ